MIECLLVADDLTGACDAAVHFAVRGYRTVASVGISGEAGGAEVAALSTDSRDFDRPAIVSVMAEAARCWSGAGPKILFKKIDSTLRGNAGIEIYAAMEAFGFDSAVITPAFPALGRVVREGHLCLPHDPAFAPIDCRNWLRSQGIEEGPGILVADAATDEDLDRIVREVSARGDRILWAGSGGLAAAIARTLPERQHDPAAPARGPVLFCIGSDHKVTLGQHAALVGRGLKASAVLPIPRGEVPADRICGFLESAPAGALLFTGGDTASAICRAIGAERIELIDEIVPGLPRGVLRGGPAEGRQVVTKSGGFGNVDALIRVAEFFG